ncbi:MAG: multicopper oxidase domain-containing protein [Acidimicrobiia bacterium]|nr:multicopper oxidase domain-containing protein [Acidimicrobiia bacterium]
MTVITDPSVAPPDSDGSEAGQTPAPQPLPTSQPPSTRDGWLIGVFVLAAGALLAAIFSVGLAIRAVEQSKHAGAPADTSAPAPVPSSAMVNLSEFKIEPGDVTVATGGTLQVMNMGTMAHNLAIKDTTLATPMIDAGGIGNLNVGGLSAGDYTLYCQVPGHDQLGMTAKLHIKDAGSAGGAAVATPTAAAGQTMTVDQMDAQMLASTKAFPATTAGLGAQPLQPTVLADGTKSFDLTAEVVRWEVSPGHSVDAWTYNGTVPAPTIHVNPGDKVRVVLHNQLPESTAIHFHGIITPNAMDGVPGITQDVVKPGQSFTYSFTAQSTPAVGMYHSHEDAVKQVPNGLAGAFLIGDEPLPAGVAVAQHQIMMLNDSGNLGLTINGKSFPATAPVVAHLGDWVEVQYMNEGQMIHPMHLHGLTQEVIAKDGYPLASPELEDTVTVAPGERYTVLIHADNPGTWAWHCHILSHAENDQGMFGMVTAMVVKP